MDIIQVNDLSFSYNGETIIDHASFAISSGDFVCISGSNGSGKTTLLKLLLQILHPEHGTITVHARSHSYVSQKAAAFNHDFPATVEEVVGLGLINPSLRPRLSGRDRSFLIHDALEKVGIKDCRKKRLGNLSGGQQQRVFIAKALVNQPEVIFLDEPTVGVDRDAVGSICCLLGALNKSLGITILMVTHDMHSIMHHANKTLAFLHGGQIRLIEAAERSC